MSNFNPNIKTITPRNSIVRKIIIGYNQEKYVDGFKLFDDNDT
jgi:hypothetical protein